MDIQEFSLEFDVLFNNIMSNKAPGLTEFEKSIFLTQAQEALVLDIYSGKLGESFESTEETTNYLSQLNKQITITSFEEKEGLDNKSVFCDIPEDVWFKTGEKAIISSDSLDCKGCNKREVVVTPVTQDTLYRTKNSPFRGPNERRVLRLDYNLFTVELISSYPIISYTLRYLSKPDPIILEDLTDGLTINGQNKAQTCKLSSSLHRAILDRAVRIAKSVWEITQ